MKIIVLSDTHGQHASVTIPEGDVIVHAGDVSSRGSRTEILDFLEWFRQLDHPHKIFIPGNHDFFFEDAEAQEVQAIIPENVICLNDSGITLDGVNFWGSPITPWFHDWAFNRKRGPDIKKHWDLIPDNTDVLITHGPPFGILDETVRGVLTGCEELWHKVLLVEPRYHLFGHIHEAYGIHVKTGGTTFVNASVLNERYRLRNKCITLEI